jgi:uncharacterized protein (DUF885 family)
MDGLMMKQIILRKPLRWCAGAGFLVGLSGVSAGWAGSVMEAAITTFSADRRAVAAAYAVPWAETGMDREAALLRDWQGRLEAVDYAALGAAERIDWQLMKRYLARELAGLDLDRGRLKEMEPLLGFRQGVQALLTQQAKRVTLDPEAAAGTLAQALKDVKALRKKLEEGKGKDAPAGALQPGPVLAQRAAEATDRLREALGEWSQFYSGFQPDFSWWVRQPQEALAKALEDTAGYLRKEVAGLKGEPEDPLIGDPIGAAALAAELQGEMICYSPEELMGIAEREFAWCEVEMKLAATAMGCQDGKEALARIKAQHAPPGGQADLAGREALEAIRFLEAKELVTIPALAAETWRMGMLGVEQQKDLPFAVYSDPGILVAYAHESMSQEDKMMSMRGNNAAFLHIVTPHELIPGHHLQGFMAKRYSVHRQLFRTPFFVEGWALHWEMLLWDVGYAATPEQKVGALFWRMHRCARILVSLKFHLGTMSPAEMVTFLVDRVGHERSGATSEVRRYIGGNYSPLYQAAYMIGGLQLRSLYQEMTGPGKLSARAFHDAVLQENAVPMEMIRAALTRRELPRDWQPDWRF